MECYLSNVFSDKEIISLYQSMSAYSGEGSRFEDSGRYIISSSNLFKEKKFINIINKIELIVEKTFNKKMKVVTAGFHLYKRSFGEPKLEPHIDDYAGEVVFDYQISSTIEWPIRINKQNFILKDNDAIMFEGESTPHSRVPVVFGGSDYVLMFIANLISEEHWFNKNKENPKDKNIIMQEIFNIREDKDNWK